MSRPYDHGDIDEDGEEVIVCPECDGSGKDPDWEDEDGNGDSGAPFGHCPVCCGFGRLDW